MKRLVSSVSVLALLALGWDQAVAQKLAREADLFAKTLKSDKDAAKRLDATRELAGIAKLKVSYVKPHTAVLLEAFQADSDTMVRVAAGSVLLAFEAERDEVAPVVLTIVKDDKQPGGVLAVAARLAAAYGVKDAVPALEMLKKREEAKDDPKIRDQRLLQAIQQALRTLSK
jgi:hypothetical protein